MMFSKKEGAKIVFKDENSEGFSISVQGSTANVLKLLAAGTAGVLEKVAIGNLDRGEVVEDYIGLLSMNIAASGINVNSEDKLFEMSDKIEEVLDRIKEKKAKEKKAKEEKPEEKSEKASDVDDFMKLLAKFIEENGGRD